MVEAASVKTGLVGGDGALRRRMRLDQAQPLTGPEDERGCAEQTRHGAAWSDNRDGSAAVIHRVTGTRIDDVAVATPVSLEAAQVIPGGGHRVVGHIDGCPAFAWLFGVL